MTGLLADLRVAWRGLAKRPGFTFVAVIALALGIGANTAIFSVVDAVLLRPLPFREADRLVAVYDEELETKQQHAVAGADVVAWRVGMHGFDGIAAYRATSFNVAGDEGPVRIDGVTTTRDFFKVIGFQPKLGRVFDPRFDAGREVVLSEKVWRGRYHGEAGILGKTILLDGEPYTIVGVVAEGAGFPQTSELWASPRFVVPQHPLRPAIDPITDPGAHYLDVVARLAPGVTAAQAQSELSALAERLGKQGDVDMQGARVVPLREDLVGNTRAQLLILFAAVGLILLIACTNVAHLLLARALSRRHEVAIRVALGATRARLARLFLAESGLLAVTGAALGLLGAMWGLGPLVALAPRSLGPAPLSLDVRVLVFTLAVAIVTALVFGVVPALTTGPPAEHLGDSARTATGSGQRTRLRSLLVGVEVALSLVLLVGAGLLVRSLVALEKVDPGFGARAAITAEVSLPAARYSDETQRARFYHAVLERLLAAPGVEAAGEITRLPLGNGQSSRTAVVEGHTKEMDADFRIISPGYLAALRLPLKAGRDFTEADGTGQPRGVLINEAFARVAWPNENPLGKHVTVSSDGLPAEVVGVVGDVHQSGLDRPTRPEVYEPVALDPWPFMTFVVRGAVPQAELANELRRAVEAVDPTQAVAKVLSMEERIDTSLRGRRFAVGILGGLAGLALILALVGIYGVISYSVAQRTRELGIRLALGARPRALLGLVVGQSLRPVLAGVAAGLVLAFFASRALAGLLYAVTATDPLTFALVPIALAGAAAAASTLAAVRAMRVDPMTALRSE